LEQNPDILAALRKWYETHRYHVPLPDERVGLVTATGTAGESEGGDFIYYDNCLELTFSFNPFTLSSIIQMDESLPVPTSDMRSELVDHLKSYTKSAYRAGKVLFNVH